MIPRILSGTRHLSSAAAGALVALGLMLVLGTGCQEPVASAPTAANTQPAVQTLNEGDVLKISFPGTPNLDATEQVRRDGRITLGIIGEVTVKGMTPAELEKDLARRYASQLLSHEVNVTVVSSTFSVFVTGAVLRPGKVEADHPLTALEAVMEAGGFDTTKANMSAVEIVRQEKDGTKNFTVDLQSVLDGKTHDLFYLERSDIVYVREKFSWF